MIAGLFSYFQPDPPCRGNTIDFAKKVKHFAVPMGNPTCPEHCYSCSLSPIQHPCLDANIHHLLSLLRALCNTCGGVIFLTTPDGISQEEISFLRFQTRFRQVLLTSGFLECLVETYEYYACNTLFWGIIVANKGHQRLSYTLGRNALIFQIDVNRTVHCETMTVNTSEVSEAPSLSEQSRMSFDVHQDTLPADEFNLSLGSDDSASYSPTWVDVDELTWDQNKSNWHAILKDADQSVENCVTSCDIWVPSSPMRLTPNKESLKYLFQSDTECIEMIENVKTEVPGFAIASRSWLSFLPEVDVETRPTTHLCDILTVANDNSVRLWVIVSDSGENVIHTQIQYMLTVGRNIKHHILNKNLSPNFTVRCKLYSTQAATNELIQKHKEYRVVQSTQKMLYPKFHEKGNFEGLQRGIASLLLSRQTSISNCVGEQISLTLSAKQVRTLLDRKKVTYVSSPPGTGKTLCGMSLYREFGR